MFSAIDRVWGSPARPSARNAEADGVGFNKSRIVPLKLQFLVETTHVPTHTAAPRTSGLIWQVLYLLIIATFGYVVDHVDESGLKSLACFSGAGICAGSMHVAESFLTLFTSVLTGEAVISSG